MFNKKFICVSGFIQQDIDTLKFILKQNKKVHVLEDNKISNILQTYIQQQSERGYLNTIEILRFEFQNIFKYIKEDIVIDFSLNANTLIYIQYVTNILTEVPKMVFVLRAVHECVSIIYKNSGYKHFGEFALNTGYADALKTIYTSTLQISELYKENVIAVDVDDLRNKPIDTLQKIVTSCNIPTSNYKFKIHNILHPSIDLLGDNIVSYTQQRFWVPNDVIKQLAPHLDVSLVYSLQGKFDIANKKLDEFLQLHPNNFRALFNKGLYEMMFNNDLLKGHKCLYQGRYEGVFGNKPPIPGLPEWKGEENKTILFHLEGGLGDEIHFVRFVKQMRQRNCKVITCCHPSLVDLFRYVDGIDIIISRTQINDYIYDCYVPGMSCIIPLGLQYKDIDNEPYINVPNNYCSNTIPRVGLRWRGNPEFEHEQHRLFPSEFLFKAVEKLDAHFVSLQRDKGEEERPNWVEKVNLSTWLSTANEINKCDFIVTSCTSIAHLAAAMGKRTFIVVPILPYFIWAQPGETSVYYKNVRLFRQTVQNSWVEPFKTLKQEIEYEIRHHLANTR